MKFKTFAILFFQDSIQNINFELDHLKSMRKHHMKLLRKMLTMSDEDVAKQFKDVPEMQQAYQDFIKEMNGGLDAEPK